MKFPYGIFDFRRITLQDYFYCDRTDRIPVLERGEYVLFLRPRRFGKSLLLSTLANYYDVAKEHEFEARTLFKAVKSSASESVFDRIFITGVSPVVMNDITSGYNIADNIYLKRQLNDICGFTEDEIEQALKCVAKECDLDEGIIDESVQMMRTYYNGYRFAPDADCVVYNPTLCTYFFRYVHEDCQYPDEMLDMNLATDDAKLEYIAEVSTGRQMLLELLRKDRTVEVPKLTKRFGIREMTADESKDNVFLKVFLYYFGVLTVSGRTQEGKVLLKIPNLAIRGLYAESESGSKGEEQQ